MLQVHVLTIFPEMFTPLSESIAKRAQDKGLVAIQIHDLRNWTEDTHRSVDDRPFGGGPGMVMMVEPIYRLLQDLRSEVRDKNSKVLLTSAKGKTFNQQMAREYSQLENLIIIAGHYEGVDQRVADHLIDEEVSIGDYVLTGGELPAMVITDAIVRLVPGVLGNEASLAEESFNLEKTLEAPQYSRPAQFKTDEGEIWNVPDVLLSGDHEKIKQWREQKKTKKQ